MCGTSDLTQTTLLPLKEPSSRLRERVSYNYNHLKIEDSEFRFLQNPTTSCCSIQCHGLSRGMARIVKWQLRLARALSPWNSCYLLTDCAIGLCKLSPIVNAHDYTYSWSISAISVFHDNHFLLCNILGITVSQVSCFDSEFTARNSIVSLI